MKALQSIWKKIGDMNKTELKALCVNGFEHATGCKCTAKNVVLLESDSYSVWYRIGDIYFFIQSYEQDNGFYKFYFLSNEHKECIKQFA